MSDKAFLRGRVRKSQYAINVSLHKDAIQHMKNDWLRFEIKENIEGKMYLVLDTWEPKTTKPNSFIESTNTESTDDLPF